MGNGINIVANKREANVPENDRTFQTLASSHRRRWQVNYEHFSIESEIYTCRMERYNNIAWYRMVGNGGGAGGERERQRASEPNQACD